MRRYFIKQISWLKNKFLLSEKAVAAVEFALILPIMLTLYIGTAEVGRAIEYNKRAAVAAAALGDLVARADGSISESDLDDYFLAAKITLTPYPIVKLEQVITSVYVDEDGDTSVDWSRAKNGGTPYSTGDSFNLPENIKNISEDNYVIVSETSLTYEPITSFIFPSGFTFDKIYYHLPRFGERIELR